MSTPLQVERQLPSLSHTSYSLSEQQQHSTSLTNVEQSQNLFGHMPSQSSCSTPYSSPSSRIRTVADSDSTKQSGTSSTMRLANTSLGTDDNGSAVMKRTNKTHVPSACVNCKRAHLACDVSRPCKRCVALNKVDTCIDIKHKKRGRPKLKDKKPHPYNTHATGDAKTWVSSTQFLPPTTTNPVIPSPRNPRQFDPASSQSQPSFSSFAPSPHYRSPPARHHHIPFNHPSFINQSTSRSQIPLSDISHTITMFLTTAGAHCAKVSNECLVNMGYYPDELVHKSLYEYVPPQDCERLQKLIDSLMENAHRYHHTLQPNHQYYPFFDHPVTPDDPGFSASPEQLQCPAYGGTLIEAADMIHLKQRNGQYDLYNVKTYLGGGLGADLTRKETWSKLYVVAFFTRVKTGACVQNDCNIYSQPRINSINNSINNINSINGGFSTINTSPSTITTIDPALLSMNHPSNDNVSSSIGSGKFGLLSPVSSPRQGLSELNSSSIYIETPPPPPPPPSSQNSTDFHSHQRSHYSTSFVPVTQNIPRSDSSSSQTTTSLLPDRRSLSSRSSNNNNFYHEMDTKPIMDSSFDHNQLDRSLHYHHIPANNDVSQSTPQFSNDERDSIISRNSESRVNSLGTESDSTSVTRMSVNSLLC
ncbi:Zn2-C6 fungal-specific transcription factor [Gigaspora margarita]|uniref:Zn2-C6 fungal-specific transcription factor n=1 Tax=Gigaspora margarita TaxID=4874 RepID=A0A8H4AHR2_GIGMA|nr:Zn2-C6 fungal-specific transcription factor [Gigaspora margarita]